MYHQNVSVPPSMVLGNFQCRSILLIGIHVIVGQGPTVLAVGAGGDGLNYSRSIVARTLMARLPRLFRTRF